jgi:hypothetical protein
VSQTRKGHPRRQGVDVIKRFLFVADGGAKLVVVLVRGARKPTGENRKVVWAEFSTLSYAIL